MSFCLTQSLTASAESEPATPVDAKLDYERALAEYDAAQQQFQTVANAYWKAIADQRNLRAVKREKRGMISIEDYVLTQPPAYSGPPKPKVATVVPQEPPSAASIPTVADFLSSAATRFQFAPELPSSEFEFKRAYVLVAAQAGLSRAQVVRIYAFEAGGNGKYDVQAGLEYDRPNAHAISTALGYNQLLDTNSVELMSEKGDKFLAALQRKVASLSGEPRRALESKIGVVHKMVELAQSVPDTWSAHQMLASDPAQGLGIHAMNLDLDVGPLLQTQKLLDSVVFARIKGLERELSAAELEMMNLTGDGNGFDMVSMPFEIRDKVPTSNFFDRGGYERNPVAIRNNTVAKLLAATDAKMDSESMLSGALDLAAAYEAATNPPSPR
jgi:stress response protein SCP2